VSAEYLLWWVKDTPLNVPGLGSIPGAGPFAGTLNAAFPGLNTSLSDGAFSGVRLSAGGWFDSRATWGMEGSFFVLERRTASAFATGDEAGASAVSNLRLWGGEANGLLNLVHDPVSHLELLAGFRYLDLTENMTLAAGADFPGGVGINAVEGIHTRNQFYGAQIGVKGGLRFGPVTTDVIGKVAMGVMNQAVTDQGAASQNLIPPPTAVAFTDRRTRDVFGVVPEFELRVGYDITRNIHAFVGYDFLYANSVARPGNQINFGPITGVKGSSFWAQGLNFGIAFSF
jgi:hypothetical protein